MSCPYTMSLGAYVLGALDPGERAALERHLDDCQTCPAELVRLAPIPGLLRHVSEDSLFDDGPDAAGRPPAVPAARPPAVVPAVVTTSTGAWQRPAVAPAARSWWPGRARLLLAAASLLLVLAVGVVTGLVGSRLLTQQSAQPAQPTQSSPVAGTALWTATDPSTGIRANAQLVPRAWGTEVTLRLDDLPGGQRCQLVVHGIDGSVEVDGWWRNDKPGSERVPAASSLPLDRIDHLEVLNATKSVLVRVDRPS